MQFQTPASEAFNEIINFHNEIMFIFVFIIVFILTFLVIIAIIYSEVGEIKQFGFASKVDSMPSLEVT